MIKDIEVNEITFTHFSEKASDDLIMGSCNLALTALDLRQFFLSLALINEGLGYQDIQDWMCKNPTQDKLRKFLDINIEVAQVTPIHSQKRPQVTLQGAPSIWLLLH